MTTHETVTRPEVDTATGDHERFAHYVHANERGRAGALILEAAVTGTPIRALCGKTWIPSRDPSRFPICPECKEIHRRARERFDAASDR